METKAWERTCDFCLRKYVMNSRDIPRIYVSKKIDLSDIESKEYIASPDLCEVCVIPVIRMLERRNKLRFSVNGNRIIQSVSKMITNQSI